MKKKLSFVLLFFIIVLVGCNNSSSKVTKYELVTTDISEAVYISDFRLNNIKIKVTTPAGVIELVEVTEEMVPISDLEKLKVPGNHTITIIYKTFSDSVTIVLLNDPVTTTYSIDTSNLASSLGLGEFSLDMVKIKVTSSSGGATTVDITEEMVQAGDLEKLSLPGTHKIRVNYLSFSGEFSVVISDSSVYPVENTFNSDLVYYSSANNLRGVALKMALRTIISKTKKTETYAQLRTDLAITDEDPNNPNNIILIYSRQSVNKTWDNGATWNREHLWPQSLGWFTTSNAGADLHHLRPENPSVNSSRGNKPYGSTTTSQYFEPQDAAKGDTARIMFYMFVRYSEADSYTFNIIAESYELLLAWNEADPVDDFEKGRNEKTYEIQGNRNPFIDHPETAELIWGRVQVSYKVDTEFSIEVVWYFESNEKRKEEIL